MNQHARRLPTSTQGSGHHWRAIQSFGGAPFTTRDLHAKAPKVTFDAICSYLTKVRRLGYVEIVDRKSRKHGGLPAFTYRCIRPGASPPVLREPSSTGRYGERYRQIWTAMRGLREFTIPELAAVASTEEIPVSRCMAAFYLRVLRKADLVVVRSEKRMVFGRGLVAPAIYRLRPDADTGPAPYELHGRTRLYDPNRRRWVADFASREVSA